MGKIASKKISRESTMSDLRKQDAYVPFWALNQETPELEEILKVYQFGIGRVTYLPSPT